MAEQLLIKAHAFATDTLPMERFEDNDIRFTILREVMLNFDGHQALRRWLNKYYQDEIFQRILSELGYPPYWQLYGPRPRKKTTGIAITDDSKNPLSPAYLLEKLRTAARARKSRLWNRHRRKYYDRVMALRRNLVDHECVVRWRCTIWDLIGVVSGQAEMADKQEAVLRLLGFDLEFLSVPDVQRVLRQMELTQDRRFKNRLLRALESSGRRKAWLQYRNRYALGIVQAFGLHDKAASEWVAFFKAYNAWLKSNTKTAEERGFPSFEKVSIVGEAIVRYKIPKEKATTRHRGPNPR